MIKSVAENGFDNYSNKKDKNIGLINDKILMISDKQVYTKTVNLGWLSFNVM